MVTTAKIGNIEVTTVVDVVPPPRDVGQIYAEVPAAAWAPYRSFALDANGMWETQYCAFLIRPPSGGAVLVDTGNGPGPHPPDDRPGQLLVELEALGIAPDAIDAVVTTHPHGDHVGWNVSYGDDGAPRATFPNARYYLAKADWEHWTRPEIAANTPSIGRSVQPLERLGALRLVDGEETVAPGVKTLPANGHTPGHQCVLIESNNETGVVIGDLIHNVAQITEHEWCPVFDWNKDMARQARREVIRQAASEGWTVFAGHLQTGRTIGKIAEAAGRHSWEPL